MFSVAAVFTSHIAGLDGHIGDVHSTNVPITNPAPLPSSRLSENTNCMLTNMEDRTSYPRVSRRSKTSIDCHTSLSSSSHRRCAKDGVLKPLVLGVSAHFAHEHASSYLSHSQWVMHEVEPCSSACPAGTSAVRSPSR